MKREIGLSSLCGFLFFATVAVVQGQGPKQPFVRRDGTTPLTGHWDAKNFRISSQNSADVYNVKAFGAVGDGITDDTLAIRQTISAAGTGVVYFPVGRYLITDSIVLSGGTPLTIRGAGHNSQIVNQAPPNRPSIVLNDKDYFRIEDLSVVARAGFPKDQTQDWLPLAWKRKQRSVASDPYRALCWKQGWKLRAELRGFTRSAERS